MFQVTKDTIVYDVMLIAPAAQPLFERVGMHCLGCDYASRETMEEACQAHGVEMGPFLEEVNKCVAINSCPRRFQMHSKKLLVK